ncbi:sugar transferase [Amylibacter sp.]|jgi:lipopolysaccharide/colanic/teichoic acid biosynthesis glycosyltransferase|nr:sugar transferase [Amylibacter sp.]
MENSQHLDGNRLFWINKRIFDIILSLSLLPLLFIIGIILLVFNLFFNQGELFFIQKRMGKNCEFFFAIKFRTMTHVQEITRKYDEPIETNRITSLGRLMRKMRIDELPQILNVLKGEMSLIGPRPDYYSHALEYLVNVEGYRERHSIRPGITGLSQIRLGYVDTLEATSKKVSIDNYYIQNVGYITEFQIILNTIIIIIRGLGK